MIHRSTSADDRARRQLGVRHADRRAPRAGRRVWDGASTVSSRGPSPRARARSTKPSPSACCRVRPTRVASSHGDGSVLSCAPGSMPTSQTVLNVARGENDLAAERTTIVAFFGFLRDSLLRRRRRRAGRCSTIRRAELCQQSAVTPHNSRKARRSVLKLPPNSLQLAKQSHRRHRCRRRARMKGPKEPIHQRFFLFFRALRFIYYIDRGAPPAAGLSR